MARVYGRVQYKANGEALIGAIAFEPKPLAYISENILWAKNAYVQKLNPNGGFDIDVAPGQYYVHINGCQREVEVPMVNEITLKELFRVMK